MNSLGLAVFLVAIAAASAGLHAGIVGGLGSPAVIAGPSGTVIRSGLTHGGIIAGVPGIHGLGAVGTIISPATAAGAIIAPGIGLLGHGGILAPGSGLEGQYIHDHSELLYDDGSYKPHVYGH